MSVSFYNANGGMLGTDWHDFYTGDPPVPPSPPVTIPMPHLVFAGFDDSCADEKARIKNVTSDGHPMIQKDFKLDWVLPHLPLLPAPPYVGLQQANYLAIVALSGSVALLAVASVTGAGTPLATCIYSCLGANLNCGDPIDQPLNLVLNESTVLTQPTAMDFAEAVFTFATSGLVSKAVGKAFDRIGKSVSKWIPDKWKKAIEKETRDKIILPLRKKAEDMAKDFFNDWVKKGKDEIKGKPKAKATLSALGVTHV